MAELPVVISVIIPTWRPRYLAETLTALRTQETTVPFEVVVVENPRRSPATATLVKHWQRGGGRVRHLASPLGANRARNAGARLAEGALLAFTDDDCVPDPRWIQRIADIHAQYPTAGLIGGRVTLSFLATPPEWLVYPFTLLLAETNWSAVHGFPPEQVVDITGREGTYLVAANMTCRRAVWAAAGGFWEEAGLVGAHCLLHDEYALETYARRHGRPGLLFDDRLVVCHLIPPERMTIAHLMQAATTRGRQEIRLYRHAYPHTPPDTIYATVVQQVLTSFADETELVVARRLLPPGSARRAFAGLYARSRLAKVQGMLEEIYQPQWLPAPARTAWYRTVSRRLRSHSE